MNEEILGTDHNDADKAVVSLTVDHDQTVNYAMQQNDVPVIKALSITNNGENPIHNIKIVISAEPEFASSWETQIGTIKEGETYNLGVVDLTLSHDLLASLTERIVGTLHVKAIQDGNSLAQISRRIDILAFDEWNGLRSLPEILAAFVTPNHPSIESILSSSADVLAKWSGNSSLSGYQSRDPQRVALTAAAIFAAIQQQSVRYINPPARFEDTGQKIRLPDRILESRLATCLDLTVLVAACLEQAGLNPLVVITTGHAFTGVWLEDETFADVATDDLLRLRKRVELGQIIVFETTLITSEQPVQFEQAVKAGRKHLEDSNAFCCVIDIRRARKSRIRPLPLRVERLISQSATPGDTEESTSTRPTLEIPAYNITVLPESEPAPETPATRLDRWKRKLLDLTMHNRLLNFKESKKNLPILCPDLGSLEDALADGTTFKVYPRLNDLGENNQRNAEVHRQRTGTDSLDEMLREAFHSRRLHADSTDTDLNRRLLEIYREAKLSIEENGANTLYLALGMLAWHETPTSPQRRMAPIILIPLEIERRSLQEGFSIRQGDDEPMVNVTLLANLSADFELAIDGLDPIPTDEHGINVPLILRKFREAIVDIDRWEVLEQAYIGHFSFAKFLMWRDLEVRADDLQRNSIVRHLIHTPGDVYPDSGAFPDPDHLDDTHGPEVTFCPLSADSSQLAAIHAAAEGKSFVLHGPPGTGKSQTITNIIAHNLALGRTVLFVSEKRAALEVVHRRLTESGLGPFCLELHSNKSRKKEVLNQLEQVLGLQTSHSSEDWLNEAQKLATTRQELNTFVSALHAIRESGESVFHGISQLIGHRDTPLLKFNWPFVAYTDRRHLHTLRETVHQLQLAGTQVGHPSTNPWAEAKCDNWTPEFRAKVEQGLINLMQKTEALSEGAGSISMKLGMRGSGWSIQDLNSLALIAESLLDCPSMPAALLLSQEWDKFKATILSLIPHGLKRDRLRKDLLRKYSKGFLSLDLDGLYQKWEAVEQARFLPKWLGFGNDWSGIHSYCQANITRTILSTQSLPQTLLSSTNYQELKNSVLTLIEHSRRRSDLQQKLFNRYGERILSTDLEKLKQKWLVVEENRFLPQWIGCGNDWSKNELDNQPEITRAILTKRSLPHSLFSSSKWNDLVQSAQNLILHGSKCEELQDQLFTRYGTTIFSLDIPGLAQQWTALQSAWFLPKFFGCRRIRKALSGASLQLYTPQNLTIADDLALAKSCLIEQQGIKAAEADLNGILNRHWHHDRSEWLHVRKALSDVALPGSIPVDDEIAADLELALALRHELEVLAMIEDETSELLSLRLNQDKTNWDEVRKALAYVSISGELPQDSDVLADLKLAIDLKGEELFFNETAPWADDTLGQNWDWNVAEERLDRAEKLRNVAAIVADGASDSITHYCNAWVPLVADGSVQLTKSGSTGTCLEAYNVAFSAFQEAERGLVTLLSTEPFSTLKLSGSNGFLDAIQQRLSLWLKQLNGLRAWCHWRSTRKEALELKLQPLIDAYETQALPLEKLQEVFDRSYYQCWCDAVIGSEPVLCGFFSSVFEDKISQFRKIDDRYTQLTRQEIQVRVSARLPRGQVDNPNSEMGLLRRQIQRQRGHLPVRSLLQKLPNLLPRLKPCLLMSPISVAQYLDPAHPPFDLVIFDEASQIPVWDAVGAMARGKEVIIVGDPKQLPPTNFFSRADSGDGADADDSIVEDLESILDDCIAAQLPERHLNWHYRSRHESLIAFSNYHYYGNRLLTFPSPHQELGVSFRPVAGEYDKGKTRTNKAEAKAVVDEVLRRLRDPKLSGFSIGIVTFSLAQQLLVDDLLEEVRRKNPEIEPYFSDSAIEPLFVKNLENVQGDERDVILFSICYGPDASGRVSMNFGPLNRDGGERRLNVAITRARQEVIVFSTLRAEQIDLSRTRAQGVADLKCFLDYAERGTAAITERRSNRPDSECESPFEEQVCDALRNKGYIVHPQVGCSGYRIDLAIVDPDKPGSYLLGIECDGANYHRSKTARDRDKLRESILRGLGWNLHRVWSTDWWEKIGRAHV